MKKKHKKLLIRIIIALVLTAGLIVMKLTGQPEIRRIWLLIISLVPYLIVGYDVLLKAVKGILRGQVLDECFLMSIATIGAFVLGYIGDGDFYEAAAVMLFYQIGELFQGLAVDKSRRNIAKIMDIRPDTANLVDSVSGEISVVSPEEVEVGSLILIKPGEKVPIDGVVDRGESSVDTAALTGESVPRTMRKGSEVLSGSVNLTSDLWLRTTKEFGDSAVSRILELVENAGDRKSRSENFIARFARIYTPAVCISALLLALIPPLFCILITHSDPSWSTWLYRALAFLVASCPCALVVSIPLGFFAGLGGASRDGILIKGSNFIEALSQTDTVVLDKTGTLTRGNFVVTSVNVGGGSGAVPVLTKEALLEFAAMAEIDSTHPVGRSLISAYGREPDRKRVDNVENVSGKGVTAVVDGHDVAVGNAALMEDLGIVPDVAPGVKQGGTAVYVAVDGLYRGNIIISDELKPGAKKAVSMLSDVGVRRTVMLTGDRAGAAAEVAESAGITEYYSELLPEGKVAKLEEISGGSLDARRGSGKIAFVGDGINDAPVLALSDVGIAMGGIGSDAAVEAADVVLMDDDPVKIARAIKISRKCMRIVYENIIFAISVKLLSLLLVSLGIGGMWLAVFADVGVMVLCVLNAIRALRG